MYRRKNSWKELGAFFAFLFLIWSWFAILAYGQDTLTVDGSVVVDSTTASFELSVPRSIVTDTNIVYIDQIVYDTTFVSDTTFVTVYDTSFVRDTTYTIVYNDQTGLKDVRWLHRREPNEPYNYIEFLGYSAGDSVYFEAFSDSFYVDSSFVPSGNFSLVLKTDYLGNIDYNISGYSDSYSVNYSDSLNTALLDTLGGLISIQDMAIPSSGYATADWQNPASDLTDFVGVVDLSDLPADFWAAVSSSDGARGRVAKDDGTTELASDWVEFDDVAETGFVWFRWSGTLSSTGTSTVRIYPPQSGNSSYAASATFGSQAVWSDYDFVSHMNSDPVVNEVDGSTMTTGGSISIAAGQVGDAIDFAGGSSRSNYVSSSNPFGTAYTELTMSYWGRTDDATVEQGVFAIGELGTNALMSHAKRTTSGNPIATWVGSGTENIFINDSNHNITSELEKVDVIYEEGGSPVTTDTFIDGVNVPESVNDTGDKSAGTNTTFYIGRLAAAFEGWNGVIDEVRGRQFLMSEDWSTQEYDNQNNPTTFWGTWTWNAAAGNVTLSGNDLSSSPQLDQGQILNIILSGNELNSSTTLDQSDIPVSLNGNELESSTVLDQSNIPISVLGNGLQSNTSIDQSFFDIQILGNDLSSSTLLDQASVSGIGVLQPSSLESAQQVDQGNITILLSTSDISSASILEGSNIIVTISPLGLSSTASLDQASFEVIELSATDLESSTDLQLGTLIVEGDATKVNLVADELYKIELSASKIYRMVLKGEEQYTILTETNEVID